MSKGDAFVRIGSGVIVGVHDLVNTQEFGGHLRIPPLRKRHFEVRKNIFQVRPFMHQRIVNPMDNAVPQKLLGQRRAGEFTRI